MCCLNEKCFIRMHLVGSVLTLAFSLIIAATCLVPSLIPPLYRMVADLRISIAIPYLLLIGLGASLFSLWYFNGEYQKRR